MRCFVSGVLLVVSVCAEAAVPYTFKYSDPVYEPWRWHQERELLQYAASCMDESEDGLMWFGGDRCIVSYDGIAFKKTEVPPDLVSDLGNMLPVTALHVFPNGSVAALFNRSLILWDHNAWRVVAKDIGPCGFDSQIKTDRSGSLWIKNDFSLWKVDPELDHVQNIYEVAGGGRLTSLCLDLKGTVWFLEKTGLKNTRLGHVVPAGEETQIDWIPVDTENDRLQASLICMSDGTLLYGDVSRKVMKFHIESGSWEQYVSEAEHFPVFSSVYCRDGTVFAAGEGELYMLPAGGGVTEYTNRDLPVALIPYKLFEDRAGRLWMISSGGYAYVLDRTDREWKTYAGVNFKFETPDGARWFNTRYKAIRVDPDSGKAVAYDFSDGTPKRIYDLFYSSQGLVWAVGRSDDAAAISCFDGTRWQQMIHPEFAGRVGSHAVAEMSDGTIWFGADGARDPAGLRKGGALQYEVLPDKTVRLLKHHTSAVLPYYVTAFEEDTEDGSYWIGSTVIYKYDGVHKAQPVGTWKGDNCVSMLKDRSGTLWLAKENFGVCRREKDSWKVFSIKDGLAGLILTDLLMLNDGSLLACTAEGLSRYDGKSWTTHAYPDWFSLSRRRDSACQDPEGAIWFNKSALDEFNPNVRLGVRGVFYTIRHQPETVAPETELVSYLEKVSQPGNTHITWSGYDSYSGTLSQKLQFSWRLDHGEWSAFTYDTSYTFLDLSSGRHVLEVRARDRAFNVDPTPAVAEFSVIPPVWRQPWFISMVIAFSGVIAALIALLIRVRENHLIEKQEQNEKNLLERQKEREEFLRKQQEEREQQLVERQKERERYLEELDRLKTGFFTNISHELRTPVTVILGRLDMLMKAESDSKKQAALSAVIQNAHRVTALITQLLDFRKIETGKMMIEAAQGDLAPVLEDVVSSLKVLADEKQITCELDSLPDCSGCFDFDKLQKIFTNLISNAIKYTKEGGRIRVVLKNDSENLEFVVEDNGNGIPSEHLAHIFDRFYRVSAASVAVGAGVGLNLTKELVELLGGEIRVESPISDDPQCPGTRFTVLLPFDQKDHHSARRREGAEDETVSSEQADDSAAVRGKSSEPETEGTEQL